MKDCGGLYTVEILWPRRENFDSITSKTLNMKLNISNPAIGSQLCLDIDDEKKLRAFYDKRMGQEVMGEDVSEEFNGYVFRITGGNDKQYVFSLFQLSMHTYATLELQGIPDETRCSHERTC